MDTATQLRAALAGRYDIEREIGAGGMATVYLARDVRHDRHVALKVLNPELGAILGVERFLAEIRVTANLQHPNLLPLFDSGEADGLLFYVMPFIEGETLRTRLEREQQLPVDEAVRIACAIASALGYAHAHDVIHRDLKPENVLLQSGQPMVADFGIALAVSKAGGARITQTGLSLGTPQYMSPEQATGDRVIDGRSDIYSLGAVLYEMLAGEPPHQGQTVQAVIARVLTERPRNVRIVRSSVPEHVAAAIDRALEKLPADRWTTAQEFADALSGRTVVAPPVSSQSSTTRGARPKAGVLVGMLVVGLVLASALAGWGWMRADAVPRTPARYLLGLPYEPRFTSGTGPDVAISPDGKSVVYVSRRDGQNRLLVRPIGSLQSRELAGTEGGLAPFFSPDGEWVGFSVAGKLKKIPIVGGATTTLADAPLLSGASWGPSNEIVYCVGTDLMAVAADGGAPRRIASIGTTTRALGCAWPEVLPDGKAVITGVWRGSLATMELAVVTMSGEVRALGIAGISPRYVRGGYLVFTRADGSVMMMRFDAKRLRVESAAIPTGENIQVKFGGATNLTVSRDGTAIFLEGRPSLLAMLVDHGGRARPLLDAPREYRMPRFSPDGRRVAFTTNNAGVQDLWIYDMPSATLTRLASGDDVHQPEWTPDGKRISYTAITGMTGEDILWQPVDGSAPAEALIALPGDQYDATWTPDGKTLIYMYDDPDPAHPSIGVMNMGDRIPRPWLATPDQERSARVSPRGDLIAYTSDESGRMEVYVRPFPQVGGRVQVSSGGGGEPIWAPDGRTLYYRDNDKVMVAAVGTTPELSVSARRVLFEQPYFSDGTHTFYDLAPDGKTFLMFKAAEGPTQFLVVVNWDEELRRRAEMSAAR